MTVRIASSSLLLVISLRYNYNDFIGISKPDNFCQAYFSHFDTKLTRVRCEFFRVVFTLLTYRMC